MTKTPTRIKLIIFGWLATVFSLFLYSFTQIDLNLTLSQVSVWQRLEKAFMYLGYFQRPLSTLIYLLILGLLFSFYLLILRLVKKNKFPTRKLRPLIILTMVILFFAYPAFSHDVFNYIFDAKIVAFYQQNPYQVKPLDFPEDPMVRFMHWTHRPSIYPPLWIGLSIIPFLAGFGKFLLQLLAFKTLMAGFYLGTLWLIWEISAVIAPKQKMFNLAFYAFSPLVLIESLVSAHNDGVMIFFALLAFYLWLKRKAFFSFLAWLFSAGIKYITVVLLPVFGLVAWQELRVKKVDCQKLITLSILFLFLGVLATTYQIGFQPWYLLWVLPFLALMAKERFIFWLTIGFSLGSLLRYSPFLYLGNWDPPVPTIKLWLTVFPIGLGLISYLIGKKKLNEV